jgi:hypothetical protein
VASGCSLAFSSAKIAVSTSRSSKGGAIKRSVRRGFPSVSVPVLSTTSVSTLRKISIASAFRKSTPSSAPLAAATMMEIGVASPSAQGHAMMITATALTSAYAIRGCGPTSDHTTNVTIAVTITVGTK